MKRTNAPLSLSHGAMALALAALSTRCGPAPIDVDPEYRNHTRPYGRIEGTVLYEGPAPRLDANGTPVGRLVLLLFRANNPPPPDGFATTAESVQTLPGSQLFAGVTALPGGRVRASSHFVFPAIVAGGEYQLRAFYSNRVDEEGFHPIYGVRSQPVRGDIAGGAVVDPTGATFTAIPVGVRGAGAAPTYTIPAGGSVTRGVTVFVGAVVPEDRPVFRVADAPPVAGFVSAEVPALVAPGPTFADYATRSGVIGRPARVLVFPSNLPAGVPDDPRLIGNALPSFTIETSLPAAELPIARGAGVVFDPMALRFTLLAATPAGPRPPHPTLLPVPGPMGPLNIPWAFPLVLLAKLHEPTDEERALLASPSPDPLLLSRVIAALNQPERAAGRLPVVLLGSLVPEMGVQQFFIPGALPQRLASARVLVSPIALEVRGPGVLVPIVPRLPPSVAAALGPALGPARAIFRCDEAGIPAGRYGITLVSARGQTWSLPNELMPIALAPAGRAAAASQGMHVRIDRAPPTAGYVCPTRM